MMTVPLSVIERVEWGKTGVKYLTVLDGIQCNEVALINL